MFMKYISWCGTVAGVTGAFLVAGRMPVTGYVVMACSSIAWVVVGLRMCNRALWVQSILFFIANILGLYNFCVI